MCAASSKMLNWQYDRLIGQLILLQDHAADPTCPCTLGESGEYCTAKHLLAIQEYATETMQMVGDEKIKGFLNDLSIEAREHRDKEKQFQCGQSVEFADLAEWARSRRKYLEPLVYKGSCTITVNKSVKKDTTAVKHRISQVPGEPESGTQKGMFGHDVEFHPKGKGHVVQIDMLEYGRLKGLKDAAGESCQLLKGSDKSIMPWFDRHDGGDMVFSIEPVADKGRKIDELIKQLREGIQAIWESDNYSAYLRTLSKFHDYSLGNCILIWQQNPEATHVAGFHTWKNLGRYVKKGEKGITILAPCVPAKPKPADPAEGEEETDEMEVMRRPIYFKPVHVFDVSQTDGAPITDIDVPTLSGDVSDSFWNKLLNYAGQESVRVDFIPRPDVDRDIKGWYDPRAKDIWIRPEEPKAQQAKTLAHELAHHNSTRAPLFDRADEETIAESVAFVVCGRFGFDTGIRSFPYVAVWAGDEKRLRNNLSAVRAIADKMIDAMEILPRVAGADDLKGELDALLDDLNSSRAAKLIKYVKRSGNYKGELSDLTPAQFKELTGKAPNNSIIDKRGKIPSEYAIDFISSELGFKDDRDLKREVERVYDLKTRIDDTRRRLALAKEKAKEPPKCSGMINTVAACMDPALQGDECKAKFLECDGLNLAALRHPAHWSVHELKHEDDDPSEKNQVIDVRYAGDASHEMRDISAWHMSKSTLKH